MYLTIVWLPLLGAIVAGLFGRTIGGKGATKLTVVNMFVTWVLAIMIFKEVVYSRSPTYIELWEWAMVRVGFEFDSLTAVMLVVVTSISLMVHLYSTEYMGGDPHIVRFMCYLSLFTWFMLILVTASNLMQLFIGWEGVGVSSYLLINFWFTRIQANKSAMKAMIVNRIGDVGVVVGILLCYDYYGTVDHSVILTIATPTEGKWIGLALMIGVMGKSAQIGLHTWLPDAMEGPTPVSSLIHAATMVERSHIQVQTCIEKFRCMLETPKVNEFIDTKRTTTGNWKEIYKKILFFNAETELNKVNQQETTKGSSETVCGKTLTEFEFDIYDKEKPEHKKKIDRDFLAWFIGYFEGQGKLEVSKSKVYIDITEKEEDQRILRYIRTELGFGQIKARPGQKETEWVYCVTGQENYRRIIHILNGNLVSVSKREQMKEWLEVFNAQYKEQIPYKESTKEPSGEDAWLAGFLDATVSFKVHVKTSKEIELEMRMSHRAQEVLERITATIQTHPGQGRYDATREEYSIGISNVKQLKKVIRYLQRYKLKTIKRLEYDRIVEIYDRITKKEKKPKSPKEPRNTKV